MGGSSKKQTVGYKYYLGMHLVLCHGPVDRITRIRVDKRTAWEGSVAAGPIAISAPNLFGGEKKEGGIVGTVDFETGAPDQDVNDYLAARLGSMASAFRGVCALVLRQVYLGLNPYLKPWSARVQRIHVRQAGVAQWYDAKAAINASGDSGVSFREDFSAGLAPYTVTDGSITAFSITADSYGQTLVVGCVGNPRDAVSRAVVSPTEFIGFSTKCRITAAAVGDFGDMEFAGPDGILGLNLGTYNAVDPPNPVLPRIITPLGSVFFSSHLVLGVWHQVDVTFSGNTGVASLRRLDTGAVLSSIVLPSGGDAFATINTIRFVNKNFLPGTTNRWSDFQLMSLASIGDMNPAHIIRECLTDPDWGMGYGDADVDDVAFMAAADTLHAEGFGLSTLWSRQTTIEDFIGEILRHIDAVLYVDNGLFTLKLARNDYNPAGLLELDETTLQRVEDLRRPALGELVNSVTVRSWDHLTSEDAAVTVHEDALVQLQGREINHAVDYPAITNATNRQRVALRDLKTLSTPLASCTVVANRAAAGLRPGGVFKLTWPAGGLSAAIMRVVKIGFGDAAGGTIKIECAEDIFSFPESQVRGEPGTGWTDPSGPPAASPARLVIEAPYLEIVQHLGQTSADTELAAVPEAGYLLVAAQRPSDEALNAEIQVDAGAGYAEAGTLDFCPVALLAADIGPLDTAVTLTGAVDVEDLAVGSLAQLGAELVRIDAITATTATLGRGALDTVPVAHAAGERLWGIDLYAASDFTQYVDGEILAVKVLPATGQGELALAAAPADSVTMDQRAIRPYPPADVRINGAYFPTSVTSPVTVTWVDRNRVQQTAAALLDWLDGGVTPEAGQTAVVELWDGATLVEAWSGETDGAVTLTVATSGIYTIRAYSQRDGHDSWTAFEHTLEILGGAERVSESGGARATEDGTLRGIE